MSRFIAVSLTAVLLATACAAPRMGDPAVEIGSAGETVAVETANADAADDPAIWAPEPGATAYFEGRPLQGLIAGTDKRAGLYIYDLDGQQLQFLPDGRLNNVDLVDGVVIGDRAHVLIGASDRGRMGIALYLFDPQSDAPDNSVRPWALLPTDVAEPYGFCMARRGSNVVAILVSKEGDVRQYRIDIQADAPEAVQERQLSVGSQSEGCVIDAESDALYVGEEAGGVWRYDLAPASGGSRTLVQAADGKRLVADVEGLTIMEDAGRRYLIASSQGDSAFAVFRIDQGDPEYLGRFRVAAAGGVDAVSGTDGLDAHPGPVGAFEDGLVVIQDDENEGGRQNYKLIDWRVIKAALVD